MAATILCVEDESAVRELIVDELKHEGYHTIEAEDGEAGLDAILNHKPDLVLCDITMPNMSGDQLLVELRSSHPEYSELPFIFLTALADREHIVAGKRAGADDYLTKPIDFDLLLATIEVRLEQVRRINLRKDEELVKLYKSLQESKPGNSSAASSLSGEVRLSDISQSVGKRLNGRLVPLAEEFGKTASRQAAGEPPVNTHPLPSKFETKLAAAINDDSVVAGKVQLLGLDEIKSSLGAQWDSHAQQVLRISARTIEQRLASGDTFEVVDSEKFLICFGSLDEREAQIKAHAILREIREKVLGTDSIDAAVKDSFGIASEVHRVPLSETDISEESDVVGLLLSRIDEAAHRAREQERTAIATMVDSARIVPGPVSTTRGAKAPFAMALFDKQTNSDILMLRKARPDNSELDVEIDALRLGRTAEWLCENQFNAPPVLIVDVSFSTLDRKKSRDQYLQLCSSLTEAATAHLAFHLRSVPIDSLPSRVEAAAHAIRRNSRVAMFELQELSLAGVNPCELPIQVATCDYRRLGPRIEARPEEFRKLVKALHSSKIRTLVTGLTSKAQMKSLFELGADFVAS